MAVGGTHSEGLRGGTVGLEPMAGRQKRNDGASVSMTLTSTLLMRRTSRRNPRIPTIPAGGFRGEVADVSAVDTWLLVGSTPRGRRDTGSSPSWPTPRGWGSTGQGLCILHEPPTYVEYPRPSFSGSRPSFSTRQAPPKQLRNPARTPGRSDLFNPVGRPGPSTWRTGRRTRPCAPSG